MTLSSTSSASSLNSVATTVAPAQDPICSLPPEFLHIIFECLGPKDILALTSTCRTLRDVEDVPAHPQGQELSVRGMAFKSINCKQVSLISSCKALGITSELVRNLLQPVIERGLSITTLDPDPATTGFGYVDYIRKTLFEHEGRYRAALIGLTNITERPFVSILCHTTAVIYQPSNYKLDNAASYTLFARWDDPSAWSMSDNHSSVPWITTNWAFFPEENDVLNFPSAGKINLTVMRNIVENAHQGLHLGYPIVFEIRARVQDFFMRHMNARDIAQEKVPTKAFSIAHIVADYAAEPQDKCRRCEVQEAMELTARVGQAHRPALHEQLRGTLAIYQLIAEYDGHSKR